VRNRRILSFARRIGKSLSASALGLMQEKLPKYGFALEKLTQFNSYVLEIGFGDGAHLAGIAKEFPDISYIGCEPYLNGVASLLGIIKAQAIENIMIYQDDAIDLLNSLPNLSLIHI
jgi:tRNA (guanine-N7-)-methyltransferase